MFLETTSAWSWIIPIAIGLLLGALIAARKNYDYSKIVTLDSEEFRMNMRKGQLIDLRSEKDFETKRINGSRNFPKTSIFQTLSKLRKDQSVYLYDNGDVGLVRRVSRKLIRKGFRPIYILKGGLDKWTFNLKE
jgi:rhodanese-related sulfurtransferase